MQAPFGERLRGCRRARRWSQEDLARRAEISPRHLSFLETGRSAPSRAMVLRLGRHLELPLRERNALLTAAGFAPTYRESALTDEALAPVRAALQLLLRGHEPYPAVVLDRHWDVRLANEAALALVARLAPQTATPPPLNLMRLLFDASLGVAGAVRNRNEVMAPLLRLLRDEAHRPEADARQRALHAEMAALAPSELNENEGSYPLLPLHLATGDGFEARLYTAITTLGTPADVTLQELRLETYFPADEASAAALRALRAAAPPAA